VKWVVWQVDVPHVVQIPGPGWLEEQRAGQHSEYTSMAVLDKLATEAMLRTRVVH